MKDFMANGRFSRGAEVIADASLAFVGNIDLSIEQVVNSTVYDLFQPLPVEFDLAVIDRFACYLPGWEMPKNSSAFLTNDYGLITDYLAEAFHYMLKHTNRYEEVNKRIHLGKSVEGRDEKGIKKTVCAFLKMLHPSTPPTDEEFEEYVAYAVECRRRIKEQMNKRKADDEFAMINLSYINAKGEEVVVYCPESRNALATQQPTRRVMEGVLPQEGTTEKNQRSSPQPKQVSVTAAEVTPAPAAEPAVSGPQKPLLREQHFVITYGATGYDYQSVIGPYLPGVKEVVVEDPYIRITHQVQNFTRFCETLLREPSIKKITLLTSTESPDQLNELQDKLDDLSQSLLEMDVVLDVKFNPNLHDREIRLDNGWVIKIGRGLDFYQKPTSWYEVGASDLSLRKCLETKVDIFRN